MRRVLERCVGEEIERVFGGGRVIEWFGGYRGKVRVFWGFGKK